ncbi:peptidoglycan DD-metalloendopeptidase family protein [Larsenimonas salina]|uniref:peptidoglycan DD-metalloendopeptidase family protein n=1 Tax=Larsenimonas salina TaxID=1295565 RepID=UPI0020730E59|nr:peptidoglycan DD-metalloendopeptidase family protein [Larsenimonas salina]MCM5704955.1 peptidoglycan DD-metalloendopeptidase family protein [Larsenimonas salina]
MKTYIVIGALAAFGALAGCATSTNPAQISDRSFDQGQASKPASYSVRRGDTLYSIAWQHDSDFRTLAMLNGLEPPYNLRPGQTLKLNEAGAGGGMPSDSGNAPQGAKTTPLNGGGADDSDDSWLLSGGDESDSNGISATPIEAASPHADGASTDSAGNELGTQVAGAVEQAKPAKQEYSPVKNVQWQWPSKGQIVGTFEDKRNITAGIDIAGQKGQPVTAAGPGIVVYAGSGVRGYGNLVILKHNDHFLSAYAHNDTLKVKENDVVSAGQTIATMGNSDADRVALHFEIRKDGQPQDPMNYLPDQG